MVLDTLRNIEIYKGLSTDIYAGLKFLAYAKSDIELGVHLINNNTKAIVSSYETVDEFVRGYESHKNIIDIQYPIIGLERVKWSPISGMEINIPYDPEKDRSFFKNPSKQGTYVDIGEGIFAIMFPEDGHAPQHKVNVKEVIKKITIKVSINNT
jgi:YhcH/YjgK/YiaL family protein